MINNLFSFKIVLSNKIGENTKNTNDNKPIVIYNEYVVITPVSNFPILIPVWLKVLLKP